MRWFGRKAAQGAARPAFARGFAGVVTGEIEDWPASYETRVRAAYLRNPVAQRAVQAHLAVWTGQGFVHADAGLRRVVETPGRPRWPLIGLWRAGED